MNYLAADRCKDCPKRNDELGCPWWWEVISRTDTGHTVIKKCGKAWLVEILIELTKALLRPQAAMESFRNSLLPLLELIATNDKVEFKRIGHDGRG